MQNEQLTDTTHAARLPRLDAIERDIAELQQQLGDVLNALADLRGEALAQKPEGEA